MSDPNVPINHPGGPTFTQRLWSEEVAIARAEAGDLGSNRDPSYEFGNGRRFVEPLNRVWDEGNVAPVSTISPVISGTSTVGSVLTVSAGSWSGVPTPSLTYQWMRDDGVIAGQTAMTYTVVAGDVTKTITCRETATNIAGSASASSNGIAIPAVIPVNTVAPVVSGLAEVGATLTATTGTWTGYPTPTYAYQWMLGISTIVGEISSTYVVLSNDQGEDITCVVTATNAAGSASESSNIISIPAANPDAVIEALFANSEVGVWYDPSDLTTMFQDRAGTTPVTADGQTVGKILDKSGRGNHAIAPSDAARPLYKTDGTYHWLQFDGVDDSLSTAVVDFSGTNKASAFGGILRLSSGTAYLFSTSTAATNEDRTFGVWTTRAVVSDDMGAWGRLTSTASAISSAKPINVEQVVSATFDASTPFTAISLNETQIASDTSSYGTGNFAAKAIYVGRTGIGSYFKGSIYSLIVRGALSTADEITATETWVAAKTGVTL